MQYPLKDFPRPSKKLNSVTKWITVGSFLVILGNIIFFGRGSQIYKESASIKLRPTYFSNNNFRPPPPRQYTLPHKQAKTVLESVFLNKINTLSVVILWFLHFGHQKFHDPPPPIFLSKNLWPPVYLAPSPFRRKWLPPNSGKKLHPTYLE